MTWVKLDDGMPDHPKLIGLSDSGLAMHIRALCYCAKHLTDGFVPSIAVGRLGKSSAVKELIERGIWIVVDGGWRIHDFLIYQRSRSDVEQERKKNRDRLKKFRERAAALPETPLQQPEKRDGNAVTPSVTPDGSNGTPSRPVPSLQEREMNTSDRSPSDGRAVWTRIIEELQITEMNRREFFDPCQVDSYEPGKLVINARKSFTGEWLNKHFWKRVREVAAAIEPGLRVDLVTKPLSVRAS